MNKSALRKPSYVRFSREMKCAKAARIARYSQATGKMRSARRAKNFDKDMLPVFFLSLSRSVVIRKPLITKKMFTPNTPENSKTCENVTIRIEIPRSPFNDGR